MHNCKEAKEQLTELLLDGRTEDILDVCEECRAEFETVAATLRMTTRLRQTVRQDESYWTNYHGQLRGKLEQFHAKAQREEHAKAQREELKPGLGFTLASLRTPLRLCVKTFLRPLPVPVGLVLLILAAFVGLFLNRQTPAPQIPAPVVVEVPVQVPVVKERTVTQIVYRERRKELTRSKPTASPPQVDDTFAQFKPADEVKLTVIKGGSPE